MTQDEKDYRDLLEYRIAYLDSVLHLLERQGRSTSGIYDEEAARLEVFEAARGLMVENHFHPFTAPCSFFQALGKATSDSAGSFVGRRRAIGRIWRDVFNGGIE